MVKFKKIFTTDQSTQFPYVRKLKARKNLFIDYILLNWIPEYFVGAWLGPMKTIKKTITLKFSIQSALAWAFKH